ncbi:MAG: hypothetical protein LBI56_00790 [Puniceicoccales bacterium]|nr:hypothetical protein [Puniceicoccales bacterium]
MKTETENTRQLAGSLIGRKIISFVVLCLLIAILAYASLRLLTSLAVEAKSTIASHASIKKWIAKAPQIEEDLKGFLTTSANQEELNPADVEAKINEIASQIHGAGDYTLAKEQEGYLGNLVIYRFGIDFNGISFFELVAFLKKVEAIGKNIVVSEFQVASPGNGSLKTHATISMLNVEK